MAVTTMALGVNAGDMKKIGLANPNTPTTPSLVKTDTKEELQKEIMTKLKGWTLASSLAFEGNNISPVFVKLIESCLNSILSNTVQTEQHY
jgi:hypothetical protein